MEYFTNRKGMLLALDMSIPYPDNKKIYIVCALYPSEVLYLSEFIFEHLDENICKLDFSGEGKSQGERTYYKFAQDADDLDDTVKFLTSRGYSVEGIIGASKYGTSVILYAALYGEVKHIISISPKFNVGHLPEFLQSIYETIQNRGEIIHNAFGGEWKFSWKMIQEMENTDMKYYCEKARGNIYVMYGLTDEFCPYTDTLELIRELSSKCKGSYEFDCDHCFVGVFDEVLEIIEQIIEN